MTKPAIRFQRANFVVSDLDRALRFYVEVIGLSVEYVKVSSETSYSYACFDIPAEARLRFATLSAPDQPRVMALTEITGIARGEPTHPRPAAIVLECPDIDGALDRARAQGITIIPEAELITFDGRRGREVGLIDPDDHLVVLFAFPEAA